MEGLHGGLQANGMSITVRQGSNPKDAETLPASYQTLFVPDTFAAYIRLDIIRLNK